MFWFCDVLSSSSHVNVLFLICIGMEVRGGE